MNKCPVCGNNTKIFWEKGKIHVLKCVNCGLGFTEGASSQDGTYHRDEVYVASQQQFINIYQKRVNLIKKYYPVPGKALEIGSSAGFLLQSLKKAGWDVMGVELSMKVAEYARKSGIPTLSANFESIKLPPGSFDLIVINHTLEHMSDPVVVLKKARALLDKKCKILIAVPNFGGLSAKIYGSRWPYLLPNEHLWHFTYPSLKILLDKMGFKEVYYEAPSGIWDYGNPLVELWQSFKTFKKRFFSNLLTFFPTLIISRLGLGSGIIIMAEKK